MMSIDDLPLLHTPMIGPIAVVGRAEIFLNDGRYLLRYVAGKTNRELVCASVVAESDGIKYISNGKKEYVSLHDIKRYIPLRPMIERVK